MNPETRQELETNPATERRIEVTDMHLFDENEAEEKPLCGADAPADYHRSVRYYLEDRLHEARVGNICPDCKALAMPLVEVILDEWGEKFEGEGRLGDAEDCRELFKKLARETGQDGSGPLGNNA